MNNGLTRKAYLLMACLPAMLTGSATQSHSQSSVQQPLVGRQAPAFRLTDAEGKPHSLADYRGRPVTLFFFCGCQSCAEVARAWAQMQQGGALPHKKGDGSGPVTLVVYSLTPKVTGMVADASGLDKKQTVFLADPDFKVTYRLYNADPCPRVFVLDQRRMVRYTNNHEDDAPRKAPALAITSRALDALQITANGATSALKANQK